MSDERFETEDVTRMLKISAPKIRFWCKELGLEPEIVGGSVWAHRRLFTRAQVRQLEVVRDLRRWLKLSAIGQAIAAGKAETLLMYLSSLLPKHFKRRRAKKLKSAIPKKLSPDAIIEIQTSSLSNAVLANKFGVTRGHITTLIRRKLDERKLALA